jgi:site-specific recombinase XerD
MCDGWRPRLHGKRDQVHDDLATLRHSLVTRFLAKNPGDTAALTTILGHADISTTIRHLHPNAQGVQG